MACKHSKRQSCRRIDAFFSLRCSVSKRKWRTPELFWGSLRPECGQLSINAHRRGQRLRQNPSRAWSVLGAPVPKQSLQCWDLWSSRQIRSQGYQVLMSMALLPKTLVRRMGKGVSDCGRGKESGTRNPLSLSN
jgi:hypothetical protein